MQWFWFLWNNQNHGIVLVTNFQNNHLNEIFFIFLFSGENTENRLAADFVASIDGDFVNKVWTKCKIFSENLAGSKTINEWFPDKQFFRSRYQYLLNSRKMSSILSKSFSIAHYRSIYCREKLGLLHILSSKRVSDAFRL
jgi:hypothetical protein